MKRRERGISGGSQAPSDAPSEVAAGTVDWRPRRIRVRDGTELRVFETGPSDPAAPVALALHGLGHWTQAAWDHLAPHLTATHRFVAFDLPGFGASDKPDASYSLAYFTTALRAVVASLDVSQFGLIGHSYGGLVAANYAAYHPDRVRSLGLIDPAGFLRTPRLAVRIAACTLARALPFTPRVPERIVLANLRNATFDADAMSAEEIERAGELASAGAMTRTFLRVYAASANDFIFFRRLQRRLAGFTGPVTLVWGRDDRYIPFRALHAAQRVYPQARALLIERCGHCPAIEYPEIVADRLLSNGI